MKKIIYSSLLLLLTLSLFGQQQAGGPLKPPPVAERWERDNNKIQAAVTIQGEQLSKVKEAFYSFYSSADALAEKNKEVPPPREEMEQLLDKRNVTVIKSLNQEQAEKFMHVLRELMPPPPHRMQGPPPPRKTTPPTKP